VKPETINTIYNEGIKEGKRMQQDNFERMQAAQYHAIDAQEKVQQVNTNVNDDTPKKIYLACPYTHDNQHVMERRVWEATKKAAQLADEPLIETVYSPVTMTHPMAAMMNEHDHNWWMRFNKPFLDMCDAMVILNLDGWEDSKGIAWETDYMEEQGKPVLHTDFLDGKPTYTGLPAIHIRFEGSKRR